MPFRVSFNTRVETRSLSGRPTSKAALFGGPALLIGMLCVLYARIGFASYALTGIFWAQADGTVISVGNPSSPTVEFATPDGAIHTFSEDYILLCTGRATFCIARNFTQGEHVPVAYDAAVPRRAFIHDWALLSNAITWFFEAGLLILFALMMAVAITRRPLNLRFRAEHTSGFPDREP